jgi:hypothetical protein
MLSAIGDIVRARGRVVADVLGWVGYGGKEGRWDRSALGWDRVWQALDAEENASL